jgi:hypothetical protein
MLSKVLADIRADVDAHVSARVLGVAQAITWRFGEKSLQHLDTPPRIVWFRRGSTYSPATYQHGALPSRMLRTRVQQLDAHVWVGPDPQGEDSYLEELVDLLIGAVYRVAHGAFEAIGDEWSQPAELTLGFVATVSFRVEGAVTDLPTTTTTLGSASSFPFDTSGALPGDGKLTAGED